MINTHELVGKEPRDILNLLNFKKPPYDPFRVVRSLGLKLDTTLTLDNMSQYGSITKCGDEVTIWVSPVQPDDIQRFVAAHEIGHYINDIITGSLNELVDEEDVTYAYRDYLYHSEDPVDSNILSEDMMREKMANDFAAELLMPEHDVFEISNRMFEDARSSGDEGVIVGDMVEKMAVIFDMSEMIMLTRLSELGFVPRGA